MHSLMGFTFTVQKTHHAAPMHIHTQSQVAPTTPPDFQGVRMTGRQRQAASRAAVSDVFHSQHAWAAAQVVRAGLHQDAALPGKPQRRDRHQRLAVHPTHVAARQTHLHCPVVVHRQPDHHCPEGLAAVNLQGRADKSTKLSLPVSLTM